MDSHSNLEPVLGGPPFRNQFVLAMKGSFHLCQKIKNKKYRNQFVLAMKGFFHLCQKIKNKKYRNQN
jgi:hypothetical protein